MEWFNEPPEWNVQSDTIAVTTATKTDFWRQTHYGFIRDNGQDGKSTICEDQL